MTIQNLSFFSGRKDKAVSGIILVPQEDPVTKKLSFAVPLDSLSRKGSNKVHSLPIDMKSRPEIFGDKAVSGSVITQQVDGKDFKVLAAYKENGIWYALCRTGLLVKGGGIVSDLIALQDSGVNFKAHGSFSLDGGAVKVGSGKGIELAKVPAERMRWFISRNVPGLDNIPQYRHDFWKIPVGAAVLVRDITGRLSRLVGEKDGLRVVDASGYNEVFDGLELARVEARKAEALKRQSVGSQPAATARKA